MPTAATTGPVVVTVGGVASNGVTFTVVTTGTIAGTVTRTSDGTPINGALVEALQSNAVIASTTTGSNGVYTITGLTAGTYDLRVSASGCATELRTGIALTGGTATVNVALSIPGTISGKVTKVDGTTPIAGAAIEVYQESAVMGIATTNTTGDYTLGGLKPGTYTVQASAAGYVTRNQTGVTVTEAATTTVNISLDATPDNNIITYIYDELGRLTGVVDPAGDTATYTYDAVGNLLSISRQSSTLVSIIEFTPKPPTITGFTPTIGTVGTAVTITGTNFEATPSNNKVKFNISYATVNSATATSINTSVPPTTGSGRVSVTTPYGQAVSTGDFFIPSSPYTAADVEVTGRMSIGETKTVTITTANKIAMILFDGTAGQRVSLNITNVTTSWRTVTIYNPDGTTLASNYHYSNGFIDTTTLPVTGTYTINIDPSGTNTGSMNVSVTSP